MSQAAPDTLLALTRAGKFYGARPVFRNVTCALPGGRVLLVVGRNGAGKSTLLKAMAGLTPLTFGKIERHVPLEGVAYLGHATFLYPRLTALENLRFWAGMYGLSPSARDLTGVLERVGLSRAAHEQAGIFSRGMAQRLTLARVLLVEPRLLLLDEPGTGLDTASMAVLHREIASARERGALVVWVSHQVSEDLARADLVLSLSGGAGVAGGATARSKGGADEADGDKGGKGAPGFTFGTAEEYAAAREAAC